MFAKNITKNLLCSAAVLALLTGCNATARMGENGNTPTIWQFNDQAAEDANLATVAYSQGNFEEAQRLVDRALQSNPKLPQALMVSAMTAEQLGHYNRARQNYEDIILLNSNDTTILGSPSGKPEKMSDIAQKRLRMITLQQSKMVIEDDSGAKVFNIDDSKALRQSKSAIAKAIFMAQKKKPVIEEPTTEEQIEAAGFLPGTMERLMERIGEYLGRRAPLGLETEAMVFDASGRLLGKTKGADRLLSEIRKECEGNNEGQNFSG